MSHPNIAHWDEVEEHEHEEGSIHSAWRYLGEAVGTVGVGVNRIRILPGCRSTPLHSHGDHEEIFFVLWGLGLSWQRTERGEDIVCEVGPGTCLVHLATGPAHTLIAGPGGLEVLAYGNGRRSGGGGYDWFPRIEKLGIGPSLFDVDRTHQWELEGAWPEPELPQPGVRPPNAVRLEDVEPELLDRGEFGDSSRGLGAAAGSVETGLNHSDIHAYRGVTRTKYLVASIRYTRANNTDLGHGAGRPDRGVGLHPSMEVLRRYWRTRAGIPRHVLPGDHASRPCRRCTRVTTCAHSVYPSRTRGDVVCLQNERHGSSQTRGERVRRSRRGGLGVTEPRPAPTRRAADVEIRLEIDAKIAEGASDEVVRTVTENARTLKFD